MSPNPSAKVPEYVTDSAALNRLVFDIQAQRRMQQASNGCQNDYPILSTIAEYYPNQLVGLNVEVRTLDGIRQPNLEAIANSRVIRDVCKLATLHARMDGFCIIARVENDWKIYTAEVTDFQNLKRQERVTLDGVEYLTEELYLATSGKFNSTLGTPVSIMPPIEAMIAQLADIADQMPRLIRKQSLMTLGIQGLGQQLKTNTAQTMHDVQVRLQTFDQQRSFENSVAYDLTAERVEGISLNARATSEPFEILTQWLTINCDVPATELLNSIGVTVGLASSVQAHLIARTKRLERAIDWGNNHWIPILEWVGSKLNFPPCTYQIPYAIPLTIPERIEIVKKQAEVAVALYQAGILTREEARLNLPAELVLSSERESVANTEVANALNQDAYRVDPDIQLGREDFIQMSENAANAFNNR